MKKQLPKNLMAQVAPASTRIKQVVINKGDVLDLVSCTALMKIVKDAVITLDKDFRIKSWNKAAEQIYGWKEEEVIGEVAFELFQTDFGSTSLAILKKELYSKGFYRQELIHKKRNGEAINVFISASSIPDKKGNHSGMIAIIRDITEQVAAERATRYHAALMENIRDAVISIDPNFNIKSWNKGAEEMYGWSEEEAVGKKVYELLQTDYLITTPEILLKRFKTIGYFRGEVIQKTKSGKSINVYMGASSVVDDKGKMTGAVTVNKDITQNKKEEERLAKFRMELEKQLENRTAELNNIFNRVDVGFLALDTNWNLMFLNTKAADLLHCNQAKVIGKNLWKKFPKVFNEESTNAFHKALDTQQYVTNAQWHPENDLWLENHIYPSTDGVSVYFRDITQKKLTEEKLSKTNRLYHFISDVNEMIIRTEDEQTLFKEACKIAIEVGKFRMAWVGLLDERTRQVTPVVYDGLDLDYLQVIKIIADKKSPEGKGPAGTAIKEGKPSFCNDIETDSRMAPWREEALKRNYRSSISLPIKKYNRVIGTFTLYADTKNFFDKEEIDLLEKVTADIAFTLEVFDKEAIRKKAEESVLKSERRYQKLSEVAPVGIFHTNKEGLVTYVNPRWSEIAGLPRIDALGNGWLVSLHEDDREYLANNWLKVSQDGKLAVFEFRFRHPDGNIKWVMAQSLPELDSNNRIVGYVGTITDITERKKAEEKIASTIDQLKLSQKIAHIGYWEIDLVHKTNYWSDEMFALFERPSNGKVLELNAFFEQIHPEDKQFVMDIFNDTLSHKKASERFEFRFIRKDGSVRYMLATGELVTDKKGTPVRINGTTQDITDLKNIQLEINKTSEQLQELTTHLQTIREEERKRIGRELHDELGQQLTAMKMDLAWINKKTSEDSPVVKEKLKGVLELLDGSNVALRKILNELRPTILDDHGLLDAMQWHSKQFTANTGIPLELITAERELNLPEQVSTCLFRIFQEALTNITRYAEANKVVTYIQIADNHIDVTIEDNGKGFDPEAEHPKSRQPYGILGMKERVRALRGEFELVSVIGKGTKIHVRLPLIKIN